MGLSGCKGWGRVMREGISEPSSGAARHLLPEGEGTKAGSVLASGSERIEPFFLRERGRGEGSGAQGGAMHAKVG
jgi:hypothetical protein